MLYARVSAPKQKDDVQRQIRTLEDYATEKNWKIMRIYKDIGSGANDQRKGLKQLVRDLPAMQPEYIVCTYKDRLARIGIGLIEQVCQLYGANVLAIHDVNNQEEDELVQALLAILYSFSGRQYCRRRGK